MLAHSLKRIVEPTQEPLTLSEVKRQLNVIADDEDTLLETYLQAARELVEAYANRSLLLQTYRLRIHDFPLDPLQLPRPPLVSVTSIEYYDLEGVLQTLSTDNYNVDADREPGVVWQADDTDWPETNGAPNGITVTYVAGYATPAAVPARAKQAMLVLIAHWYRVREAVGQVGDEIALTFTSLCRSLKPGDYP